MRQGVQVLALTARLHTDPVRRIGETAQMTLHAMSAGGLAPGGAGIRDAQKVRLMHAAVRHLALASDDWVPVGTPVNQEDLAFTLLTFSIVALDSIRKLGRTSPTRRPTRTSTAGTASATCSGSTRGSSRRRSPAAASCGSASPSATGRRAPRER